MSDTEISEYTGHAPKLVESAVKALGAKDAGLFVKSLKALSAIITQATENLNVVNTGENRQYIRECGRSLVFSSLRAQRAALDGDFETAARIFTLEVSILYEEWNDESNFWLNIYSDPEALSAYRAEQEKVNAALLENGPGKIVAECQASIAVLAYNKLSYTRQCVESIRKNYSFSDGKAELILVNNGSTDGTKEYFESVPNAKVIHIKENLGGLIGTRICARAACGKYLIKVCNDVVVTKGFLENLVSCMESDDKIGIAVPCCNLAENRQGIDVSYKNLDDMQEFAAGFNKRNPHLWEDRPRLLSYAAAVRMDVYRAIGYDRLFCFDFFSDDDLCTRFRRAGYRLVLAGDTFVHHFGTVTLEWDQNNGLLDKSRDIYFEKYNIDALESAEPDSELLKCVEYRKLPAKVLAIDPGFGSTPLCIRNTYRKNGIDNVEITAFTSDPAFLADLRGSFGNALTGAYTDIPEILKNQEFDHIIFCADAGNYPHPAKLLKSLEPLLTDGGQILLPAENPGFFKTVYSLLNHIEISTRYRSYSYTESFVDAFNLFSADELQVFGNKNLIQFTSPVPDQFHAKYEQILDLVQSKQLRDINYINTYKYVFSLKKQNG